MRRPAERAGSEKIRLLLVETFAQGQTGSMKRYADLLSAALADPRGSVAWEMQRINLGPPDRILSLLPSRLRSGFHHAWITLFGWLRLRRHKADLVHLLDGSYGYLGHFLTGTPAVASVHDVIPLLRIQGRLGGPPARRLARWFSAYTLKGLEKVSRIVASSRSTAVDLQRFTRLDASSIAVVHLALCSEFSRKNRPSRKDQSRRRQILHLGHSGFYKNRIGVLKIFARVRKCCDVDLVMAGTAPDSRIRRLVRELDLDNNVVFVEDPDDSQLRNLYRQASLFLFPSLYEGFGWPPLEAMSFGCPVVCSAVGSLPEVVGDAALCRPLDEETLASSCLEVLEDEKLAAHLARRGKKHIQHFTVERMRKETLAAYRRALTDDSCHVSSPRVAKPRAGRLSPSRVVNRVGFQRGYPWRS